MDQIINLYTKEFGGVDKHTGLGMYTNTQYTYTVYIDMDLRIST